jgi:transcriptional regulator with XRE-family HTH domain
MGFKENLKSELSYQDMLVKELAARTGISKKTLDNYLNVRGNIPSAEAAVRIAQELGVTVEYLVTGEDLTQNKSTFGPEIRDLIQKFKQLNGDDRKMVIDILHLFLNRRKKPGKNKTEM